MIDDVIQKKLWLLDTAGYVTDMVRDAIESGDIEELTDASNRTQELVDLIDEALIEAEGKAIE